MGNKKYKATDHTETPWKKGGLCGNISIMF